MRLRNRIARFLAGYVDLYTYTHLDEPKKEREWIE